MIFFNSILDVPDLVARFYLGREGESREAREEWLDGAYCGAYPCREDYARKFLHECGSEEDAAMGITALADDLFAKQVFSVRESDQAIHVFVRPEVIAEYP